jgi:hypothetical protein
MVVGVIVLVGFALFILTAMGAGFTAFDFNRPIGFRTDRSRRLRLVYCGTVGVSSSP